MKKFILCGIFFLTIDLFSIGFMVHTLVKTPTGLVPIETLKEGDVVCADGFDEQYYSKPVLFANIYQTTVIAKVIVADEVIFTTPDQCFLNEANEWIPVANLEAGGKVKSTSGYLAVESVEFFYQPIASYSISVSELGNFYISKREILAHNFVALVVFGGAIAKGLGFIIFEKIVEYGTYTAAVATAGYFASRYQRSQQQPKAPEKKPSVKKPISSGGGSGKPPDDPNDPWYDPALKKWSSKPRFKPVIWGEGPGNYEKFSKQLTNELIRAKRSLEAVLNEHQDKLANYRNDPDAYDNMGFLKNVANQKIREQIIRGRVEHLQGEIEMFEEQIRDIASELIRRGVK